MSGGRMSRGQRTGRGGGVAQPHGLWQRVTDRRDVYACHVWGIA